jgi:hypothetical protein
MAKVRPRFAFLLISSAVLSVSLWCRCASAEVRILPEHLRPDPFGGIVHADRNAGGAPAEKIVLAGARAAFVSCHLTAGLQQPGPYSLEVRPFPAASGLAVELYREWFHYLPESSTYYPDALIPVAGTYRSRLPEPDNRIEKQMAQGFWLDIWISGSSAPGTYRTEAVMESAGRRWAAPIEVQVLAATVPAENAVEVDHNTYGTSWFADQYPALSKAGPDQFYLSDRFFQLIHAYHQIFYEHRGLFHQLGYGHGGKVAPEFAPRLEGRGKHKHIADWTLFDKHYGPLLDGSAFAGTHLGPRPIEYMYLPINPEWPASMLWWGEPGYAVEFVNVVSAMESHFRERGWTKTRFEMFFNHKKRYKGFDWDGDEARFPEDFAYPHEYARLLKLSVPAGSPVHFVYRADVSWSMERQIREFAGIIQFWVCGSGEMMYQPGVPAMLRARGDVVFTYGAAPQVTEPSSHVTLDVLRQWIWGTNGFVRWLVTDAGEDPWFRFAGGAEAMVYPGDRFGIPGPVPSIRLKIQRNAVQDINLLDRLAKQHGPDAVRAEVALRFNQTRAGEWWSPRPPYADMDPLDRTNADEGAPVSPKFNQQLDAGAWQRVHAYVLEMEKEGQ